MPAPPCQKPCQDVGQPCCGARLQMSLRVQPPQAHSTTPDSQSPPLLRRQRQERASTPPPAAGPSSSARVKNGLYIRVVHCWCGAWPEVGRRVRQALCPQGGQQRKARRRNGRRLPGHRHAAVHAGVYRPQEHAHGERHIADDGPRGSRLVKQTLVKLTLVKQTLVKQTLVKQTVPVVGSTMMPSTLALSRMNRLRGTTTAALHRSSARPGSAVASAGITPIKTPVPYRPRSLKAAQAQAEAAGITPNRAQYVVPAGLSGPSSVSVAVVQLPPRKAVHRRSPPLRRPQLRIERF